ncbi:hypothetical protein B0H34DRAFT_715808 [Crassisporium funariophilum]|nr:hypothetical protein B0H34DRAFT_715808 [Crassisporium funariophilum]
MSFAFSAFQGTAPKRTSTSPSMLPRRGDGSGPADIAEDPVYEKHNVFCKCHEDTNANSTHSGRELNSSEDLVAWIAQNPRFFSQERTSDEWCAGIQTALGTEWSNLVEMDAEFSRDSVAHERQRKALECQKRYKHIMSAVKNMMDVRGTEQEIVRGKWKAELESLK